VGLFPSVTSAQTTSFTIDREARLSPGGTLITVSGSITCEAGKYAELTTRSTQGDGSHQKSAASFTFPFACLGSPQTWQAIQESYTGPFHKGKATVVADAFVFDLFGGSESVLIDETLRLRSETR
jgi:hypothetical protein